MKYRVRNIKTWELYDKDVFLGRDGSFYNRVFECIGDADKYLVEAYLFKDKNGKEVYVNDVVVLRVGEYRLEYRIKISPHFGIVLEDWSGKEYPFEKGRDKELELKEEQE